MTKLLLTLLLGVMFSCSAWAGSADRILESSGVKGGLVVHVGCADPASIMALRASDSYLVHGLDVDAIKVSKARKLIQSKRLYGPVSVDTFDGKNLPYADNLVNLLIDESGKWQEKK